MWRLGILPGAAVQGADAKNRIEIGEQAHPGPRSREPKREPRRRFGLLFYGHVSVMVFGRPTFNLAAIASSVTEFSRNLPRSSASSILEAPRRRATVRPPWILPNDGDSISCVKYFRWRET